jgi:hypothetical protein
MAEACPICGMTLPGTGSLGEARFRFFSELNTFNASRLSAS